MVSFKRVIAYFFILNQVEKNYYSLSSYGAYTKIGKDMKKDAITREIINGFSYSCVIWVDDIRCNQ